MTGNNQPVGTASEPRRVSEPCPLCRCKATRPFHREHDRDYRRCPACQLTFLPPEQRPALEVEKARYETHRNSPGDDGYVTFLNKLVEVLTPQLAPGAEGLDYGSGPGPTLSLMLEELGFPMTNYDPLFAPDEAALGRSYDFITCTETVEHFHRPGAEFRRLQGLLRPGGWLGIMTGILASDHPFPGWWYTRDLTHVCFYNGATLGWIARRFGWELALPAENVALFRWPN